MRINHKCKIAIDKMLISNKIIIEISFIIFYLYSEREIHCDAFD